MPETVIDPAVAATPPAVDTPSATPATPPAAAAPVADPPKPTDPPAVIDPPKPVEITYALKLPETPALDPASLERTVAFAKERGLSNEAAQAALDLANREVAATNAALAADYAPGDPEKNIAPGRVWIEQEATWRSAALADPAIGNGKPEQLVQKTAEATRALDKFFRPEFKAMLLKTGYGSNPELLYGLAQIGASMGDGKLVVAGAQSGVPDADAVLARQYPSMVKAG